MVYTNVIIHIFNNGSVYKCLYFYQNTYYKIIQFMNKTIQLLISRLNKSKNHCQLRFLSMLKRSIIVRAQPITKMRLIITIYLGLHTNCVQEYENINRDIRIASEIFSRHVGVVSRLIID